MNRLEGMTWSDLSRRIDTGSVLLVPVGSTEQHGPHLPLSTDTDIAVALADGAAARDARLVVAPALAYGSSGEHQDFPGTVSIGSEVTELVLIELGRSAAVAFDTILVVSTHGGNAEPVTRAVARLGAEGRRVGAWSPRWRGDLHAGRTETSLMLAIAPERVHLERAEAGDLRPIGTLLPILCEQGVRAVSANGVLGDPSGSTAAEGHRLLAEAVDALLARVSSAW